MSLSIFVLGLSTFIVAKVSSIQEELYFHAENVRPPSDDFYTCTMPVKIDQDEVYVNEIETIVDDDKVHHIMVYAYRYFL